MYITVIDKTQLRVRLAQVIIVGLMVSTIFLRMPNTQARFHDRFAVLFTWVLFIGMSSIMNTALALPVEKAVFLREINNGYYRLSIYYMARIAALMIVQALYALVLGIPVYWIVNLNPSAGKYTLFLVTLVLISLISGILGYGAGVLFPTPMEISAVVPTIVLPLILFSGFFIPSSNIPPYWIWLYYLSFFQYSVQILLTNEFNTGTFEICTAEDIANKLCPLGQCYEPGTTIPVGCPKTLALTVRGYSPEHMVLNFGVLIIFLSVFALVGGLVLYRFTRKSE
jgi:ATP-binding cassette subfamily G (WHITE) protein 1